MKQFTGIARVANTLVHQRYVSVHRHFSTSFILRNETIQAEKVQPKPQPELSKDIKSIDHLVEDGIVHSSITDGLKKLGFKNLTLVQSKTIEPILKTTDDIVTKAKTGTGKTLAFGIPIIENFLQNPTTTSKVRSLIIAPTRDLAYQIRDEINKLADLRDIKNASKNKIRITAVVGGESRWAQIKDITNRRGSPAIVVATPGRFLDLIREQEVAEAFEDVQSIILDEADRLLGEGFRENLVEITDILKENRENSRISDLPELKTMLFSATLDKPIVEFSKTILRKGFHFIDTVDPNEPETHEKINQSLILTQNVFESHAAAISFIQNESKRNKNFKAIVFLSTVKGVSYFYDILHNFLRQNNHGLRSYQLHGQLRQPVRDKAVKNFRNGFSGILVASDVGARGMDFPNVTNVIQIGLPMDATNYVHRVGRTARGGSTGKAVMILTKSESRFVRVLKNRKLNIAEQFEYSADEQTENDIVEIAERVPHKFTLEMVIESLAGFSKSVSNNYRLNMYEVLEDIRDTYARFKANEDAKPPISASYATRVLALNLRSAREFFEIKSREYTQENNDDDNDGDYVPKRSSYNNNNNNRGDRGQNNRYRSSGFGNDGNYDSRRSNFGDRGNDRRSNFGDRGNDRRQSNGNKYNQRGSRSKKNF